MRKVILSTLFLVCSMGIAQAQRSFGYFSYDNLLKAMPGYEEAQASLAELKEKYDAETKRVEADFNSKYEEFLEGQKEFPSIILQKRQTELQEMMEKNVTFKREARRLYKQAEDEAMAPIKAKLDEAIAAIGTAKKYDFILNTDSNACPWVNKNKGDDITNEILKKVK
ncbi:MAG: OmpH family outer membrane protein [Bacteroidaceae bacterium]|nr:OmpH family outer membrane protein [Bacteroidaceae bacterium]